MGNHAGKMMMQQFFGEPVEPVETPKNGLMAAHEHKPEWKDSEFTDWLEGVDLMDVTVAESLHVLFAQDKKLPGESCKIDRLLEAYSKHYMKCNPRCILDDGTMLTQDGLYILYFACLMLSTDAHTPHVKNKMSCNNFIRSMSGIHNGGDFPESFLSEIFMDMTRFQLGLVSIPSVKYDAQEDISRRQFQGEFTKAARPRLAQKSAGN